MTFPSSFYIHTVTVEPYVGVTATGDSYGPPVSVACWLEDAPQLQASGTSEEAVSAQATRLFTDVGQLANFAATSRVTLPSGQVSRVSQVNSFTSGPFGLPDHLEVHLS